MQKKYVVLPLVIGGITLSFHHQSSLGNLFLIVPDKLHPLWYTQKIGLLYFLSAVAAGLAMVSFQSIASSWALKRGYDVGILRGLAKGTSVALLVYLAVRLVDLGIGGNLTFVLDGSIESLVFLIEITGGVLLPIVLLGSVVRRGAVSRIFIGQVLVMVGIILNRFNANFLAQTPHGGSYFPSWMEIAITVGLISLGVFLYRLAVLRLEVFPSAEVR
jgi:Ni/Fe-hydrogenase subunit HybB-like protein